MYSSVLYGSPDIDEGSIIPRPRFIDPENITVKIGSPAYIIDGFPAA